MLGEEQRLEAGVLGRAAQLGRADRVVGREDRQTETHTRSNRGRCDDPLAQAELARERVGGALAEAVDALADPLGGERRHPHVRQPAGDHRAERREVVVDVDREAVHAHAAATRGSRSRRSCGPRPRRRCTRGPRARGASTPASRRAATSARLHRLHERADVRHVHDRIADELAGPVVGQLAAAVGLDDVDLVRERAARRAPSGGRSCRRAGARGAAAGRAAHRPGRARAGAPGGRRPRDTRRGRGGRSTARPPHGWYGVRPAPASRGGGPSDLAQVVGQDSSFLRNSLRNCAASAPSSARWSHDMHR